jgi:hypothetical protein
VSGSVIRSRQNLIFLTDSIRLSRSRTTARAGDRSEGTGTVTTETDASESRKRKSGTARKVKPKKSKREADVPTTSAGAGEGNRTDENGSPVDGDNFAEEARTEIDGQALSEDSVKKVKRIRNRGTKKADLPCTFPGCELLFTQESLRFVHIKKVHEGKLMSQWSSSTI